MTHDKQKQVLDFWFGDDPLFFGEKADQWFSNDRAFDDSIRNQFGDMITDAAAGAFDDWAKTPRGAVALVLLLDQFPRLIFRNDRLAFVNDDRARRIADMVINRGFDRKLNAIERIFLYLPLEHAEDLSAQQRAVELFKALVNDAADTDEHQLVTQSLVSALQHREIIEQFGRFPARNDILGRPSTKAESAFLNANAAML